MARAAKAPTSPAPPRGACAAGHAAPRLSPRRVPDRKRAAVVLANGGRGPPHLAKSPCPGCFLFAEPTRPLGQLRGSNGQGIVTSGQARRRFETYTSTTQRPPSQDFVAQEKTTAQQWRQQPRRLLGRARPRLHISDHGRGLSRSRSLRNSREEYTTTTTAAEPLCNNPLPNKNTCDDEYDGVGILIEITSLNRQSSLRTSRGQTGNVTLPGATTEQQLEYAAPVTLHDVLMKKIVASQARRYHNGALTRSYSHGRKRTTTIVTRGERTFSPVETRELLQAMDDVAKEAEEEESDDETGDHCGQTEANSGQSGSLEVRVRTVAVELPRKNSSSTRRVQVPLFTHALRLPRMTRECVICNETYHDFAPGSIPPSIGDEHNQDDSSGNPWTKAAQHFPGDWAWQISDFPPAHVLPSCDSALEATTTTTTRTTTQPEQQQQQQVCRPCLATHIQTQLTLLGPRVAQNGITSPLPCSALDCGSHHKFTYEQVRQLASPTTFVRYDRLVALAAEHIRAWHEPTAAAAASMTTTTLTTSTPASPATPAGSACATRARHPGTQGSPASSSRHSASTETRGP
ncbi:uncharacterized protein B0I36DRAFT_413779 [Microdochium trichocladiopsis]|uniref:Uncharacterized protein n=1 Tax=Microdochium trichocladiopsis TaxID=1682393 RepID=A0A9P9BNX3_9PEZI|nr:uncharacterized protein B0I36DRAFT_413779 [Microdochium trichocladiopsis]KAH7028178.1 hypothetical protein B0I36DRAFT_413779 [Microdochium trichocladiopsis]